MKTAISRSFWYATDNEDETRTSNVVAGIEVDFEYGEAKNAPGHTRC